MKKLLIALIALFITLSLTNCSTINSDYCSPSQVDGVYLCEKTLTTYFDTTISLKLYYEKQEDYDVEEIFSYFENTTMTYHQYFDNYHEYTGINNVYTINHSSQAVTVDEILFDAISYGLDNENNILLNGKPLFDIALGPVLEIWHDARESTSCDTSIELGISYCPVPSDQIDGIEFNTDPADVVLNQETMSVSFSKDNMSIDLGGFAKGYLTKVLSEHFNELGITYLLNVGNSNVVAGGENPLRETGLYYIALTQPTTNFVLTNSYFMYLKVPENLAIVTSGNYQRFFKGLDDSLVYHHIIDPSTNYPGGYSMAVTIIYPDSAMADILSTAIYLMPLDDALTYVENTENLEAVWYHYDGSFTYSSGFEQYIYNLED